MLGKNAFTQLSSALALGTLTLLSPALQAQSALSPDDAAPVSRSAGPLTQGLDTLLQEYEAWQQAQQGLRVRTVAPFAPQRVQARIVDGAVLVDLAVEGDSETFLRTLESLGAKVTGTSAHLVSALLPLDQLAALPGMRGLRFAQPSLSYAFTGSVPSEGDVAQRSDLARADLGLSGAGQTVGILSDSFACLGGGLAADIASGDLPADVLVLEDYLAGDCSDEGRAMAQIVHDVAPGASLAFHTAFLGIAGFAQGILDLADAGSDVIVDDVIYFAEPMFQDGIIAQAADNVSARGIPFFSSAGNAARQSYEAPFSPSGLYTSAAGPLGFEAEYHDFDPGAPVAPWQQVSFDGGATIVLQWTDPFFSVSGAPGAQTDLDVCFSSTPGVDGLIGCVASDNLGRDPVELAQFFTSAAETVYIAILRFQGPAPQRIKYVWYGNGIQEVAFATDSATNYGHANAAGAVSVGAAAWFNTPAYGIDPPVLNYFSAGSGVPIFYDTQGQPLAQPELRAKPEITAPDGNNTTFFFSDTALDSDALPNFFGTSAAAPHAAAVAALMREFNPDLGPADILRLLQDTAIDITAQGLDSLAPGAPTRALPAGFDADSGAGLIDAQAALANTRVTVAPTAVDFGDVDLGSTATVQVWLRNNLATALPLGAIETSAPFRVSGSTCAASLAAAAECAISVTFEPAGNLTSSAVLGIAVDAGLREVALTGTGVGGVDWGETGAGLPGGGQALALSPSGDWAFAPQGNGPRDTRGFLSLEAASSEALARGRPGPGWQPVGPLFAFTLEGGQPGTSAEVTYRLPAPLPEGVRVWKFGPPTPGAPATWYLYRAATVDIDSGTITLTLTDGGIGDGDGSADGYISDPVGLFQYQAQPIPALPGWTLPALVALLLGLARFGFRSGGGVRRLLRPVHALEGGFSEEGRT